MDRVLKTFFLVIKNSTCPPQPKGKAYNNEEKAITATTALNEELPLPRRYVHITYVNLL